MKWRRLLYPDVVIPALTVALVTWMVLHSFCSWR